MRSAAIQPASSDPCTPPEIQTVGPGTPLSMTYSLVAWTVPDRMVRTVTVLDGVPPPEPPEPPEPPFPPEPPEPPFPPEPPEPPPGWVPGWPPPDPPFTMPRRSSRVITAVTCCCTRRDMASVREVLT